MKRYEAGPSLEPLRKRLGRNGTLSPGTPEWKEENPLAGAQNKAVVGDFLDGPEHISRYPVTEPIRDEELAIPVSVCQEYR